MDDSFDEDHYKAQSPSAQAYTLSSMWLQTRQIINGIFAEASPARVSSKSLRGLYLTLVIWLIWKLLLLSGLAGSQKSVRPTQGESLLQNYFAGFEGFSECGLRAGELYIRPPQDHKGFYKPATFCHDRKDLLQALSNGGRIGFDAPYQSKDCAYRWFHPAEICSILTRFDSLVFIGDDSLLPIYGGLNILIRQRLASGAIDSAGANKDPLSQCRCNNQYIKQDCLDHFLKDSEQFAKADDFYAGSPSICTRPRHAFLYIKSQILDPSTTTKFHQLVPQAPRSSYRPIPIITSMSPSTLTSTETSSLLLSILNLADDTARNTPMLWIGPTAAGHIEIRGRKGNQEIWDFDRKMAKIAAENDIEVMGMWNLTVQADSWDGVRFGQGVAIVQAMMVMNWLSRLESS